MGQHATGSRIWQVAAQLPNAFLGTWSIFLVECLYWHTVYGPNSQPPELLAWSAVWSWSIISIVYLRCSEFKVALGIYRFAVGMALGLGSIHIVFHSANSDTRRWGVWGILALIGAMVSSVLESSCKDAIAVHARVWYHLGVGLAQHFLLVYAWAEHTYVVAARQKSQQLQQQEHDQRQMLYVQQQLQQQRVLLQNQTAPADQVQQFGLIAGRPFGMAPPSPPLAGGSVRVGEMDPRLNDDGTVEDTLAAIPKVRHSAGRGASRQVQNQDTLSSAAAVSGVSKLRKRRSTPIRQR